MTGSGVRIIRCVGGIVRDAAGRLLLVQRANDPGRGNWSLPGGRVEAGESDAAAVAREMLEETGLRVRAGALVGTVERPAPAGTYAIYDYVCDVLGGQLRPGDDASAVAFVDADQFAELERANALSPHLAETLRDWRVAPLAPGASGSGSSGSGSSGSGSSGSGSSGSGSSGLGGSRSGSAGPGSAGPGSSGSGSSGLGGSRSGSAGSGSAGPGSAGPGGSGSGGSGPSGPSRSGSGGSRSGSSGSGGFGPVGFGPGGPSRSGSGGSGGGHLP